MNIINIIKTAVKSNNVDTLKAFLIAEELNQKAWARCINCDHEIHLLSNGEKPELSQCPKCKNKAQPANPKEDFWFKINWQELRILFIWAERWILQASDEHAQARMATVLSKIGDRIKKQTDQEMILFLTDEINQLKSQYGKENVQTDFPTL